MSAAPPRSDALMPRVQASASASAPGALHPAVHAEPLRQRLGVVAVAQRRSEAPLQQVDRG